MCFFVYMCMRGFVQVMLDDKDLAKYAIEGLRPCGLCDQHCTVVYYTTTTVHCIALYSALRCVHWTVMH
jgi:hypothetical protein